MAYALNSVLELAGAGGIASISAGTFRVIIAAGNLAARSSGTVQAGTVAGRRATSLVHTIASSALRRRCDTAALTCFQPAQALVVAAASASAAVAVLDAGHRTADTLRAG